MELTLFSSDSSGQYKKDIYNVIAAPYNSKYRFRYRSKYIEPKLHTKLSNNSLVGTKVLIAFRTNSDKDSIEPFVVPIRWGVINKTYFNNEICVIDFNIKGYPEFNQDYKTASNSKESNSAYTKKLFAKEGINNKYVLDYVLNIVSHSEDDFARQESLWISIIGALKHHAPFINTSFFRTVLPAKSNTFADSLILKGSQYKEIEIWHFCSEDSKSKISNVEIQCNTNYLNPVSGDKDQIECRYDRVNYGFQAVKGKKGLKSQIVFKITSLNEKRELDYDTETKICVPVVLKTKILKKIIQAFLSFLGSGRIVAFSTLMSLDTVTLSNWGWLLLITGAIAPSISWLMSNED